ncbi:hypothetical protein G7Z17_g768 [Cylindrodendrum hubeiense]|uniref:Trichothecene 3-O-acetyltransferase-like N-terminal domain-containing protein n=1 Tax=Cylindrodendrum hubeiense TaxID=595255 RepID=A0A9P5HMS4_9HYPO|nr:hypothetical protein G7Z17_g768 [Cylindrodendrum hubeiense]
MDTNTNTTATGIALDVDLGILGQPPSLRVYTPISLCFPVLDPSAYPTFVSTLEQGLERLSESFPWVAGQVVNEFASESNSGIYKIKALEKVPRLLVKDLRDDPLAPTMEGLRTAGFPMSMLDENVIAPRRTFPGGPDYDPMEPVLILQANLIDGGLIITVNGQHSAMDMVGQGEVIRLLSKACKDESFTEEELAIGNFPRNIVIPLLDSTFKLSNELENQIAQLPPPQAPSSNEKAGPPPAPPNASWAYFSFSPKSLSALKSSAEGSADGSASFISTDDALSALIWQSVTRARLPRLDPADETMLSRAVDTRSHVGAPKAYPGILQNIAYSRSTLQQLLDEPLGVVASKLRLMLDPSNLRHRTRALATYLNSVQDKSVFNIAATVNPATDILLSSWSKFDCCNLDFNLGLGKPESVRRPRFNPFECLMYLMPKALDGEISLGISLRDEDMERLRLDTEFTKYGRYIG